MPKTVENQALTWCWQSVENQGFSQLLQRHCKGTAKALQRHCKALKRWKSSICWNSLQFCSFTTQTRLPDPPAPGTIFALYPPVFSIYFSITAKTAKQKTKNKEKHWESSTWRLCSFLCSGFAVALQFFDNLKNPLPTKPSVCLLYIHPHHLILA